MPITSLNLSLREFLSKANKAQQVQWAELLLQGIPGNTIRASKKKRKKDMCTSKQ